MRVSTAVEIMLLHLENLKRNYEREHAELEETRRVLVHHKLLGKGTHRQACTSAHSWQL
jgi:hypothetical protein